MAKGDKKALIVGGYGGVGQKISARLSDKLPGRVVVGGRDYEKANRLSDELQGKALPAKLDISDPGFDWSILEKISLVVMCVDQDGADFVEQCIRRGIDYIDITAGAEFHSEASALDPIAREHGSTVVLSVGLAPGVTNLLAKRAKSQPPEAGHADLFIMLGLGERHGEAAVRWTVQSLSRDFYITRGETSRLVHPFAEGKVAEYPLGYGERRGYRFNLPEQHLLPASLGIGSASS